MSESHLLAHEISKIADGVRASENRITVSIAPEDHFIEEFPEKIYNEILEIVEDTQFIREHRNATRKMCERHSWSSGRSNHPIIPSRNQPMGYELQINFVK